MTVITSRITKTVDNFIQDQTSPSVMVKFNRVTNSTTLASDVTKGSASIVVTSSTGIIAGSYLIIYNATSNRYFLCTAVSIASAPTITIDTPIDFSFTTGSIVDVAITNLAANGSSVALTYGIRGVGQTSNVPTTVDITRIIMTCVTTSAVSLDKFADITSLTNGLVLQHRKLERTDNIFNVKNNREIAGIQYDYTPYTATNPVQGIDGFVARLTFAGQNKIGVVKRLRQNEDLEFIVRDDLSAITTLEVMAEGHIVE